MGILNIIRRMALRVKLPTTSTNSEVLDFKAYGGMVLFYNYSTEGKGAPELLVINIRAAECIEVRSGGREHRFRLEGSVKELDTLHPAWNRRELAVSIYNAIVPYDRAKPEPKGIAPSCTQAIINCRHKLCL